MSGNKVTDVCTLFSGQIVTIVCGFPIQPISLQYNCLRTYPDLTKFVQGDLCEANNP